MKRSFAAVAAILFIFSSLLSVQPVAAAMHIAGCLSDIGDRVPVLFVHGFIGSEDTWGKEGDSNSLLNLVMNDRRLSTEKFDYTGLLSTQWVTNAKIGPKLADWIACRAQSSREQGGSGKVIVITHSMGTLALRFAANRVIDGHRVADDIGLAIMIAGPNLGSDVDLQTINMALDKCSRLIKPIGISCAKFLVDALKALSAIPALRTGSQELADLPKMPATFPVLAISGNVRPFYGDLPLIGPLLGPDSNSDGVVGTKSAEFGNALNGFGGVVQERCSGLAIPILSIADCSHSGLLTNRKVQRLVVDTITRFVDWLHRPTPTPTAACPTWQQMQDAIKYRSTARGGTPPSDIQLMEGPVCENNVAGAIVKLDGNDTAEVDRLSDGKWRSDGASGFVAPPLHDKYCAALPPTVLAFFSQKGYC